MGFEKAIKELSASNETVRYISYRKGFSTYLIIRSKVHEKQNPIENKEHYFAFKKKDILAKNTSSCVYRGFKISEEGELIKEKLYALKQYTSIFEENSTEEAIKEATLFYMYSNNNIFIDIIKKERSEKPPEFNIIMPYFEDHPISSFSFLERVIIFFQMAFLLQDMQNDRPKTKNPVFHGDIKKGNILFSFKKHTPEKNVNAKTLKNIDVRFIDFELSSKVTSDSDLMKIDALRGTDSYIAPELYEGHFGLKSDIFSLSVVLSKLFNVQENTPKNYPIDILKFMRLFFEKMKSESYANRPDSNTVLLFATALYNFCIHHEEKIKAEKEDQSKDPSLAYYASKVILLAYGLWNEELEAILTKEENPTLTTTLFKIAQDFKLTQNFLSLIIMTEKKPLNVSDLKSSFNALNIQEREAFLIFLAKHKKTLSKETYHILEQMSIEPFLNAVQVYTDKKSLLAKKQSNGYTGSRFGYSNIEKANASQLLISTLSDNTLWGSFFSSPSNEFSIKALQQGELKKLAKPLLKYLSLNSPASS